MQKFKNLRPQAEAIAMFKEQGWEVDMRGYDEGSDWIDLKDKHDCYRIRWSSFNGHFYGHTIGGRTFSNESSQYDDEPWYQKLLSIFFVEPEHAA